MVNKITINILNDFYKVDCDWIIIIEVIKEINLKGYCLSKKVCNTKYRSTEVIYLCNRFGQVYDSRAQSTISKVIMFYVNNIMCSFKLSSLLYSTLPLQTLQLHFLIRNCVMKNVIPEQAETYNKVAAFPSWQHNPESEQNGIEECIECSRMFIYLLALHLPLSLSLTLSVRRGWGGVCRKFQCDLMAKRHRDEQWQPSRAEQRTMRIVVVYVVEWL